MHEACRFHLGISLGRKHLAKLTAMDIQQLYTDRLTVGKLSPTTVVNIHTILHKGLKQARRWGLITHNVAEDVDPPRKARPATVTWNRAQVQAFLAVSDKDDLAHGQLAVKRSLSRGAGGSYEFGPPKTAAGRRSIALPASLVRSLQKHRVRQAEQRLRVEGWADMDMVFATSLGTPILPNHMDRNFKRLIAEADLPQIRIHDLRHTAATLMLANGEHPKIVQERLGHSDVSMTLNRYSHVTMHMQREAADRLDDYMDIHTEGAS